VPVVADSKQTKCTAKKNQLDFTEHGDRRRFGYTIHDMVLHQGKLANIERAAVVRAEMQSTTNLPHVHGGKNEHDVRVGTIRESSHYNLAR
jgi:hypothetical protein